MRTLLSTLIAFGLTITSIGQNSLTTVKIGSHEWTSENLTLKAFRNGEAIPQAKNADEWKKATESYSPVWCYPDFNEANAKYGIVYNYYAMSNEKKLCPDGYHIPTPAEWKNLVESVNTNGKWDAGRKLKAKTSWKTDATTELKQKNGTDDFGFNGGPGGFISFKEGKSYGEGTYTYSDIEKSTAYWTRSTNGYNVALGDFQTFFLSLDYSYVQMHDRNFREGYFIRCVKNESDYTESLYFPNVLFTWYHWMTENLNVKEFRNGEKIPYAKNKKEWAIYAEQKTAACASVNFDSKNDAEYGLLYNWHAVKDSRGLAPLGWRIPVFQEWGNINSKVKDKYPNNENWSSEKTWKNIIGTNESGFNGKAAGKISAQGEYSSLGTAGNWWHSQESKYEAGQAYSAVLNESEFSPMKGIELKEVGLSVRCIKE